MRGSFVKYGIIAALGLAAAYLLVQIFTVLDRPYRTETAILYDMSDSLYTGGYLVFTGKYNERNVLCVGVVHLFLHLALVREHLSPYSSFACFANGR